MTIKYNVCLPRKYKDRGGKEQLHFWNVGNAYSFETKAGVPGITIRLFSRTLMTDELVLFEDDKDNPNRENKPDPKAPEEDDIPF